MPLIVTQLDLTPDPSRLLARSFVPGTPNFAGETSRVDELVRRVLALPAREQERALAEARLRSQHRFDDIESVWRRHAELAARFSPAAGSVDGGELRQLLGAYLTQAYAYESAALTNPSIVPVGDVGGATQEFVMSARAIGEGHISSVAFFSGSIDEDGRIRLDTRHPHVSNGTRSERSFGRDEIRVLLSDMGFLDEVARTLLDDIEEPVTAVAVEEAAARMAESDHSGTALADAVRRLHWVVTSNYDVTFDSHLPVSEHVLSPAAPAESAGIEDVRLARFTEDDGSIRYLATYTAYDGVSILPQLIETRDFHRFRMSTLSGPAVHHKGMALFPRRVDGEYLALTRHDHERMFLARTDDVTMWRDAEVIFEPQSHWEAVQTGNCGSPIETDDGWLVLTHGVGPMRRYTLGALLLDLDHPEKLIGRLEKPLIEPRDDEPRVYVPDVVYTCGGMVHRGMLVVPYGYADYGIRFAITTVDDVLAAMQ